MGTWPTTKARRVAFNNVSVSATAAVCYRLATRGRVRINPDLRTIAWPNGADGAPEFLLSLLRVRA